MRYERIWLEILVEICFAGCDKLCVKSVELFVLLC